MHDEISAKISGPFDRLEAVVVLRSILGAETEGESASLLWALPVKSEEMMLALSLVLELLLFDLVVGMIGAA